MKTLLLNKKQRILQSAFGGALMAILNPAVSSAEVVRCLTEPVNDVAMTSTVPGTLAAIHFHEGSFVAEGEVVVALEARTEELDIQRRTVLVDNLRATMERSEMLLRNTSSISLEEVDEARSEYQIAVLELELAREALNKKQVRAPFSGVVTDLPLEVGEYCEPPQILLRMVDTREFYCVANIDPTLAARLRVGDPAVFLGGTLNDGRSLNGSIVFISPVVDSASGLLRIKVLFDNPDGLVRPGEGGLLQLSPNS